MKRNNYIQQLSAVAIVLLLAVACGKGDELPNGSEMMPVQFQTSLLETKAEHLWSIDGAGGTDWLQEVGVYAYRTSIATPFFGNATGGLSVKRTGVGAPWIYTPITSWPGNDLTFYGYAPTGDGGRTTGPADGRRQRAIQYNAVPPTIDFIVDGYPEFQIDLLLSVPQTQSTGVVVMPFRHVLTKITFSASVDNLMTLLFDSVKVDEIKLLNIVTHGTRSMDATQQWTYPSDQLLRNFTLERTPALTTHTPELNNYVLTTTYQQLSTKSGTLLMLPQPIGDTKSFSLTYTTYKGLDTTTKTLNYPLFPVSPDWRQGEQINYRILIKSDGVILSVYGLPGSP